MTLADGGQTECAECGAPVVRAWVVCAACGASLRAPESHPHEAPGAPALPSTDSGYTAFMPVLGGAGRPITVMDTSAETTHTTGFSLGSLAVHSRPQDSPPPLPPTEDSYRPVTTVPPGGGEAGTSLPVAEPPRAEPGAQSETRTEAREEGLAALRPTQEMASRTEDPGVEITASSPNLPSTVVVVSHERAPVLRISREDMEELRSLVDDAVARAFRELGATRTAGALTASAASHAAAMEEPRSRLASIGVAFLLGGILADLVALNWDTWITGNAVSSMGWLQQTGVIGTAAMAGAGASAVAVTIARLRRRHARQALSGSGSRA